MDIDIDTDTDTDSDLTCPQDDSYEDNDALDSTASVSPTTLNGIVIRR
ncbi:MAG: hypothetical protein GY847_05455 [Proteobacteria bacterium]|nr:hypothetical protein [Pseudomonadota bacterium]